MTIIQNPLPYFNQRIDKISQKPIKIDMIVVHCSLYTAHEMIDIFKGQELSAHYIIEANGDIIQLVDEKNRAWHAGIGSWRSINDINAHSIGIELVHPTLGHLSPYPEIQLNSFRKLTKQIINKYRIQPHHIFAHSDMAPTRRYDPGRFFPWKNLAKDGIGSWPADTNIIPDDIKHLSVKKLLEEIGYPTDNEKAALYAFLRHFMPEEIPDREVSDKDQIDFLWHYEENLPKVLEKLPMPSESIINRLQQVARTYKKKH
ncbi:MAG: N-acetylmuramoyl-L-alanine amidase [Alphaproteobacteria bacterium]|nr:N-acetylmuramoyl-L-alanine amidase [Alphaproteobacteria bacterium]